MDNNIETGCDKTSIKIKFRNESYTFESNTYQSVLNDVITKKEYTNIINTCSNLVGHCMVKKKKNDTIVFPKVITWFMLLSTFFLIAYFSCLAVSFYEIENLKNETTMIVAVICVVFSIAISLGLSIYNFLRPKRKFQPLSYFIVKDISEYLDKINEKYNGKVHFELFDYGNEENRHILVRWSNN